MRLLMPLILMFLGADSAWAELKTIYVAPQIEQQVLSVSEKAVEKKKANKPRVKLAKHSALNFIEPILGIENVKPWHKGTLAKDEMKPAGRLPTMTKFATKVFASKENTRGGTGIGGGGCGCN